MYKTDTKSLSKEINRTFWYCKVGIGITIWGAIKKSNNDIFVDCKWNIQILERVKL